MTRIMSGAWAEAFLGGGAWRCGARHAIILDATGRYKKMRPRSDAATDGDRWARDL
jgi:hypothetical protein